MTITSKGGSKKGLPSDVASSLGVYPSALCDITKGTSQKGKSVEQDKEVKNKILPRTFDKTETQQYWWL